MKLKEIIFFVEEDPVGALSEKRMKEVERKLKKLCGIK